MFSFGEYMIKSRSFVLLKANIETSPYNFTTRHPFGSGILLRASYDKAVPKIKLLHTQTVSCFQLCASFKSESQLLYLPCCCSQVYDLVEKSELETSTQKWPALVKTFAINGVGDPA
jgi:hypothetical protein